MNTLNMTFIPADSVSLALFTLFAFVMFFIEFFALKKAEKKLLGPAQVGFLAILLAFSALVLSGAPAAHPFPVVPLLFAALLGLGIWFSFSKYGKAIGAKTSLGVLVGFQGFRLPLELILHRWAEIGTVPPTMTWTGQNIDILSGIIALLCAPLAKKNRAFAWIATAVGLVLFANVLRVVVLSSPLPIRWPLERPLQLVMHMPYALIGPLFVIPALIAHLITLEKLCSRK